MITEMDAALGFDIYMCFHSINCFTRFILSVKIIIIDSCVVRMLRWTIEYSYQHRVKCISMTLIPERMGNLRL